MSTKTNQTDEHIIETIDAQKNHIKQWHDRLDRLEDELTKLQKEAQITYRSKIAALKTQLNKVETRLQAMAEGDPKEWQLGRQEYEEKFTAFRTEFMKTAEQIKSDDETVALGWLQGFSDKRPLDSEGWVEGMGHRTGSSEGWVEGMGHQGSDSKGWREGYNESQK